MINIIRALLLFNTVHSIWWIYRAVKTRRNRRLSLDQYSMRLLERGVFIYGISTVLTVVALLLTI